MSKRKEGGFDLSESTGVRTMQLVEASRPNPSRPRLSDPIEAELDTVERKAAAMLAAREQSQWKFNRAHKELMEELGQLRDLVFRLVTKQQNKNNSEK